MAIMNQVLPESEFRHINQLQYNLYLREASDILERYIDRAIEAGDAWFSTMYYQFHLYAQLPGYSSLLLNFLENAIAKYPDTKFHINALGLYADLQNALGNSDKVIESCQKLLSINHEDYEALHLLATNGGYSNNLSTYKRHWRKRKNPEHIPLGFSLYEFLERNHDQTTERILLEANAFAYKHIKNRSRPTFTPIHAENRVTNDPATPLSKPIFIMGLPRSGSTLIERQLAAYDGVLCLGECNFLKIAAGFANADIFFSRNYALDAQDYKNIHNAYHNQIQFREHTAPMVIDKSLNNLGVLPTIAEIFNDFSVIVCYRDPANNALSIFRKRFVGDYHYAYNLELLCKHVADTHKQIERYKDMFSNDERVHFLDVDHYVNNPDNKDRLVSQVLGKNAILRQNIVDDMILTASAQQARKPMNPANMHKGELLDGVKRSIDRLLT
jgi:hypothetical protein